MLPNKIFFGVLCMFLTSFCSTPAKNGQTDQTEKKTNTENQNNSATNNEGGNNIVYNNDDKYKSIWGVWGGGELTSDQVSQYKFLKGWYIVYQWKKLEPQKDNFDWNYFDSQVKFAADHNLAIGFMIWVGPHSPEWIYNNGVPKVTSQTVKRSGEFPYYLDKTYKDRYYNMIDKVSDHIKKMPPKMRDQIVMWMAAEGSTGDPQPYKGLLNDSRYTISEQQWFDFKKDVWTHMYNLNKKENPNVHLLVNQANDGKYFNWLVNNLPGVWMKAGDISHTYQFNGELDFYDRMKKLEARTQQDLSASRLRGEITVQGTWFNQNESWNMYALLTSSLHFGLDIFNAAPKYLQNPGDTSTFNFFNFYAGQKVPSESPGAFCVFKDALDAADTRRFPESKYGPVVDPSKQSTYARELERKKMKAIRTGEAEDEDNDGEDQGAIESNAKNNNLSDQRIQRILQEYAPYGAKRGDFLSDGGDNNESGITEEDVRTTNKKGKPINPKRQQKMAQMQRKGGGKDQSTSYQKKREANMVVNDIGVNLIPGNYYRYLSQYSPNTTSRGYWRIGPTDQPYGRFARGFDAKNGMTEMFFTLDKDFYKGSSAKQNATIRIIYLDKGTGTWSLNYSDGTAKKEAYKVTCGNTGRWIIKSVPVSAVFAQKLERQCDLSIKYLSGDNTIFNSIEVLR